MGWKGHRRRLRGWWSPPSGEAGCVCLPSRLSRILPRSCLFDPYPRCFCLFIHQFITLKLQLDRPLQIGSPVWTEPAIRHALCVMAISVV
jgi:hypothetical protein